MRPTIGLIALAAVSAQPVAAAAASSAAPAARNGVSGSVVQSRQQAVQLALLQGQGQGQGRAAQGQGSNEGPSPGRVRRTTVLSRVILFAPAAAIAGLLIALSAGGGRDRPPSG